MPIHDWSRIDAGIFHHLHLLWIARISAGLNGGLLPEPYYALAEPVLGDVVPDVLTLRALDPASETPGTARALEYEERGPSPQDLGEPLTARPSWPIVPP